MQHPLPIISLLSLLVLAVISPTLGYAKGRPLWALLPVGGVNVSAETAQGLLTLLQQELRQRRLRWVGVGVIPTADCDDLCMAAIGRRADARRLIRLEVGRLGGTYVLRLTLYDVAKGARQGSWQEVLKGLGDEQVQPALLRMINGFAPPPPIAKGKPWYKRWWVWAAAAGVVTASTALVVTLTPSDDPDYTLVPP
ncbi:MAG: hypothetical protein JRH20_19965 [Deltaproteobacteria bacterium]|nr:hypothetical protein [Deltaproteobacteria bacterium]